MRKRLAIGDIFEIETPRGLAYLQYSHHKENFGELVRVLPGLFQERPGSISQLVSGPTRFFIFFAVAVAAKLGLVTLVTNEQIPEHAAPFPTLRIAGLRDPKTRRAERWWLWDDEEQWPIELTPEYESLSIRAHVNHGMLVEMIATGWSPANRR